MRDTQMLQDKAYEYLIEMIKQGELESDRIYSLNKMSNDLGISRTPFRDAVMRLAQDRYIDILPSKGFVLHKLTREDIEETYEIRHAIESYCMKQLAIHVDTARGKQYYDKICGKVKLQEEIIQTSKSAEDFGRKDYEFHRSIVQYVDNNAMLEIYRSFMYRIFWLNVTSFQRPGRMEETVMEHSRLLTLIRDKNLAALDALLEEHLTTPKEINLQLL